jgi:Icc-related predicted phosphoesterase
LRILAVSDRVHPALYDHLDKSRFPNIDALISCGDLPNNYLDFLASSFNVPAYYVRGNHDRDEPPPGWINLDERVVRLGALNLIGFEGCRLYTEQPAVQYSERQMWVKVGKTMVRAWVKGGVDIVVSHSPPFELHDDKDLAHTGFRSFRWIIDRFTPRFFLHGHNHLNYAAFQERVSKVGVGTTLINTDGYYVVEV